MLVLKNSLQHEELLTAAVHMRGELGSGRVADDRGGARDLAADPVEHAPLDARDRRGGPGEHRAMHGGAPRQIGVQVHDLKHIRDPAGGKRPVLRLPARPASVERRVIMWSPLGARSEG